MLSPGNWWERVPKDAKQNLQWRLLVLHAAKKDRALQRALEEVCRRDVLFYLNTFCFIYEPRERLVLPFITYPVQDDALQVIVRHVEEGRDLVIGKSRDMGASWMCVAAFQWMWQYHGMCSFSMMSRKAELVDDADPDSLFWKFDFLSAHQPDWLRPKTKKALMIRENLANGSNCTGETTTGEAMVGGRKTAALVDEFSRFKPRDAREVLAGTADTTRCRIFNFTVFGTAHPSYEILEDARAGKVSYLRLHWSDHPEKARGLYTVDEKGQNYILKKTPSGYPLPEVPESYVVDYHFAKDQKFPFYSLWFDKERKRPGRNDREIAEMLEIDALGSAFQFFDGHTIKALVRKFAAKPREFDLNLPRERDLPATLTPREDGPVKLWLTLDGKGRPPQRDYGAGVDCSSGVGATNSCLSIVDGGLGEKVLELAVCNLKPTEFADWCVALCRMFHAAALAWELEGPGVAFGKRVIELGYFNVHYRKNEKSLSGKSTDTPGWSASHDDQLVLMESYREALCGQQFVNRSELALNECLSFVYTPTREVKHSGSLNVNDPTGARENHGDRVIADALAWKMVKDRGLLERRSEPEVKVNSMAWRMQLGEKKRKFAWQR